jgi:periplasmic protein TonB
VETNPLYPVRPGVGAAAASLRLVVSLVLAGGLMLSLFWFLSALIAPRKERSSVGVVPQIDFTRLKRDTELQEIKRVKPQIEKPEPPPAGPTVSAAQSAGGGVAVDVASLAPASVNFGGIGSDGTGAGGNLAANLVFGTGSSNRDAVPEVRIDPQYPPEARARGIEGWVTVRFDVGADGNTRNIQVVDAKPRGVFERETIRAVSDWRYSPKIENGKPVERKGIEVRLEFTMRS